MSTRIVPVPEVVPDYTADTEFSQEFVAPDGVIKGILFRLEGTLTGPPTAVNMESPERLVERIRIEFPRPGADPYVIDSTLRDLRLAAEYLNARAPVRTVPVAATATESSIYLPLGIPNENWPFGIDTRELGGQLISIRGRWAPAVNYGTATTGLTNGKLRVSFVMDDEDEDERFALLPITTVIRTETASRFERKVETGNLDLIFGVLVRAHDDSATTADRVDGLIRRMSFMHTQEGTLSRGLFIVTQEAGYEYFKLEQALVTAAAPAGLAGTAFAVFNRELGADNFPDAKLGDLSVELDLESSVPVGVTAVTPAASDAAFLTVVGLQANDQLLAKGE